MRREESRETSQHQTAPLWPEVLAIVGEPDGGFVILGAREEEVAVPVVLEEGQGPLVPLHQYRPHVWIRRENLEEIGELGFAVS